MSHDRPHAPSAAERSLAAMLAAPCPSIASLLAHEPDRLSRLAIDAPHVWLDLSRHCLPLSALDALLALAGERGVAARRDAMLRGDAVNRTEQRAALHSALRVPDPPPADDPAPPALVAQVHATRRRMTALAERVRSGRWRGASGRPLTDVVVIGIGGSALGPQLACEALAGFGHRRLAVHWLSNIDPQAWTHLRGGLSPAHTLVVVASKSWTTQETACNAQAVRDWLAAWLRAEGLAPEGLARHFVAVTARPDLARAFGLGEDAILPFADWVGGRFSVWSSIGLPLMLAIGPAAFDAFLAGAHAMDRHFAQAPLARNAPVLLALLAWWNRRRYPGATEVIVPYAERLSRLPAHLQQLAMESNGKSVTEDGEPVAGATAPVLWGAPGTDAQHSFFQLLHQGPEVHPVELIVPRPAPTPGDPRGDALLAHALAQADAFVHGFDHARALADGRRRGLPDALAVHRTHPGNRPVTVLTLERLEPASLGALMALYEHRTATLGWLWQVDPFDQWGVELGKRLAGGLEAAWRDGSDGAADAPDAASARLRARLRPPPGAAR